eukprot:m.404204 g.404204  ORF g.404204 m.404204 type:complete len:177 (+) comp56474_c0_seq12:455-985(+)
MMADQEVFQLDIAVHEGPVVKMPQGLRQIADNLAGLDLFEELDAMHKLLQITGGGHGSHLLQDNVEPARENIGDRVLSKSLEDLDDLRNVGVMPSENGEVRQGPPPSVSLSREGMVPARPLGLHLATRFICVADNLEGEAVVVWQIGQEEGSVRCSGELRSLLGERSRDKCTYLAS